MGILFIIPVICCLGIWMVVKWIFGGFRLSARFWGFFFKVMIKLWPLRLLAYLMIRLTGYS